MLGGLVTPADSMNASLGMGLTIASKLEGECLWGGRGSVVRALAAKARGPGFNVFSSSKLSDVDGVMSSVVL